MQEEEVSLLPFGTTKKTMTGMEGMRMYLLLLLLLQEERGKGLSGRRRWEPADKLMDAFHQRIKGEEDRASPHVTPFLTRLSSQSGLSAVGVKSC